MVCWLRNSAGEKSRGARPRCAWTCGYNGALAVQLSSVALEHTITRNSQNCNSEANATAFWRNIVRTFGRPTEQLFKT